MVNQNRVTRQKELIGSEIKKIKSFFSCEYLFERVNKKDSSIGIATIYRYLKESKVKKELFSYICDRKQIYSRGKKSHCHFECEESGRIIHFDVDNIDFLKDKVPGAITSFQLEVKGICSSCTKKD